MIESRIENWARWARGKLLHTKKHCGSIEHQYRSPQHWWPEEPRKDIDILDAIKIERAISIEKGFPKKWHLIIKGHYVLKADIRTTCRKIFVHWDKYDEELEKAVQALENRLTYAAI